MPDAQERNALLGYVTGVVILSLFFWFTFDDAYGRLRIGVDPANSPMGFELQPYTQRLTGLVCMAAPILLAYFPRYTLGKWAASAGQWVTVIGTRLLHYGGRLSRLVWKYLAAAGRFLLRLVQEKLQKARQ